MMGRQTTLLVFISLFALSQALNCWVCSNVEDNEACMKQGKLLKCQKNEKVCQNEVRRGDYGMVVTKLCKQTNACNNNFIQNPRAAWYPSQCNTRTPSSVCRCCCNFDGCNTNLECESKPRFDVEVSVCTPPEEPENGRVRCSGTRSSGSGLPLGTRCVFLCNRGFSRRGAFMLTCVQRIRTSEAVFDNEIPRCLPNQCAVHHVAPENGDVTCTKANEVSSICSFNCQEGFVLKGSPSSRCLTSRVWSSKAPSCVHNRCSPPHVNPVNGLVTCTDSNNIGSECRFVCNEGFALEGRTSSVCQQHPTTKNIRWSSPPPVCHPIQCLPLTPPRNGEVTCTNGHGLGSVCSVACEHGYHVTGSNPVTCLDDEDGDVTGTWSSSIEDCQAIVCPSMMAPRNGSVDCSDSSMVGSECSFACNPGFDLIGVLGSVCEQDSDKTAIWSSPSPICTEIFCDMNFLRLDHGQPSCSNGVSAGSTCVFTCDKGYMFQGAPSSVCGFDGLWNTDPPKCSKMMCSSPPEANANSRRECGESETFRLRCEYTCDDGYKRIGQKYSTCVEDANGGLRWVGIPPTCEVIECPKLPSLRNGDIKCSDSRYAQSVCTFDCHKNMGYELFPPNPSNVTCGMDSKWDVTASPCCARSCPPYARMDMVVVLDSSSSIGNKSWIVMTDFARNLVASFDVSSNYSRIATLRFHSEVDTESLIHFSDYPNDKSALLDAIKSIPYDGMGTKTGKAVKYVNDEVLKEENGNRPDVKDVVVVITDGRAQDGRLLSRASSTLRERGTLLYAVGVVPNGKGSLDPKQLKDIAGTNDRVLIAEKGFEGLDSQLLEQLSSQICENRCESFYQD